MHPDPLHPLDVDVTALTRSPGVEPQQDSALQRVAAAAADARQGERERMARELHDDLGQRLTAIKLGLTALQRPGDDTVAPEHVEALIGMVDDALAAMRRLAVALRPPVLDDLGLNAAIASLAADFGSRAGLACTLRLADDDPPVDDPVALALYRTVQEALTNAARHARARTVCIDLSRDAGTLELAVTDDGIGLPADPLPASGHFGLLGLRERAAALAGALDVTNAPAGGVCVRLRLPLSVALGTAGTPRTDR